MVKDKGLEYFCENIKRLRLENGLSQKTMAKLLGIGVKSLSSIENGILPPRLDSRVLFNVHRHFGLAPKDLFHPKD